MDEGVAIKNAQDISAIRESVKSAHKRIDELNRVADSIRDLATSVAEMTTEIKMLTNHVDDSIKRTEQGQKEQGGRIGNIEKSVMLLENYEKTVEELETRLTELEKEPAEKWKDLMKQVTGIIVAAVLAYITAKFT